MAGNVHHRWRHAARFALFAFVVFSFLPVWSAWYFGTWEATGERAPFWFMLASFVEATKRRDVLRLVTDFYDTELVKLAVLLVVAFAVGWWRAE